MRGKEFELQLQKMRDLEPVLSLGSVFRDGMLDLIEGVDKDCWLLDHLDEFSLEQLEVANAVRELIELIEKKERIMKNKPNANTFSWLGEEDPFADFEEADEDDLDNELRKKLEDYNLILQDERFWEWYQRNVVSFCQKNYPNRQQDLSAFSRKASKVLAGLSQFEKSVMVKRYRDGMELEDLLEALGWRDQKEWGEVLLVICEDQMRKVPSFSQFVEECEKIQKVDEIATIETEKNEK